MHARVVLFPKPGKSSEAPSETVRSRSVAVTNLGTIVMEAA